MSDDTRVDGTYQRVAELFIAGCAVAIAEVSSYEIATFMIAVVILLLLLDTDTDHD